MKQIRTTPSYVELDVDQDTKAPRRITGTGVVEAGKRVTVSNADADRYEKLADEAGVRVTVVDVNEDGTPTGADADDDTDPSGATGPAGAVTGQGDPVPTTDGAGTGTATTTKPATGKTREN